MSHSSASTSFGSSRTLRQAGGAAALALSLAACRSDSVTMPQTPATPICYAGACDAPGTGVALDAPIVIQPLEDAVARVAPNMMDSRTRADLGGRLTALRAALLSGDRATARMQLAHAYDVVDAASGRLRANGSDAVLLDLADLSVIRLALVPASQALGVGAR